MASHIYGCRIIQRLLENCELSRLAGVLNPIVNAAGKLSRLGHVSGPLVGGPRASFWRIFCSAEH